jgi:hypothetical protein
MNKDKEKNVWRHELYISTAFKVKSLAFSRFSDLMDFNFLFFSGFVKQTGAAWGTGKVIKS